MCAVCTRECAAASDCEALAAGASCSAPHVGDKHACGHVLAATVCEAECIHVKRPGVPSNDFENATLRGSYVPELEPDTCDLFMSIAISLGAETFSGEIGFLIANAACQDVVGATAVGQGGPPGPTWLAIDAAGTACDQSPLLAGIVHGGRRQRPGLQRRDRQPRPCLPLTTVCAPLRRVRRRLGSCVEPGRRRGLPVSRTDARAWRPIRLIHAAHAQQEPTLTSLPATDLDADPNIGRVLGDHYRIDSLLERGGMGAVYRGTQLSVDRPVAVKLIAAAVERSAEHIARFRREAEAMAKLRHPNTVRLFDFGVTEEGQLYMVMELLIGRDLANHLAHTRTLTLPQALGIVRQIAQSLSEAHAQGIVHRDLKPGNIFLSRVAGGDSFVKVMDFGIAGIDDDTRTHLTQSGAILGTAAYMSPEQAQGFPVDGRADLYAVGLLLYEMLVGRSPFDATSTVSLIVAQMTATPPPIAEACPALAEPERVQALLDRLLAKDPEQRLGTAAELITLVDALLQRLGPAPLVDVPPLSVPFPSDQPLPRTAHPTPLRLMLHSTRITSTSAATRRRIARAFGLGFGAFALAACGWFLVRASGAGSASDQRTQVTIASIPSGASVRLAGAELGKTPYELHLKRPTEIEVALPEYAPRVLVIAPEGEPNVIVKLVPRPPLAGAAP